MTVTDISAAPSARPDRVGQGTAVEQSRAVAQVQAAVLVAMQYPRNIQASLNEMRQSCQQMRLAEKAFYRFGRGGQQVTGSTVHLARELARCWGNIDYGVAELLRDDDHGQSELLAFAWDLERNSRNSTTFINPHKRTGRDAQRLLDVRDIYENNANAGARRVREAIFAVLPKWFTDEAEEICAATLKNGGGVPLPKRIAKCIEKFEELRVSVDQLETKVGVPTAKWTAADLAQLTVIFGSIDRGETRVDDEFAPRRVSVAELVPQQRAAEAPKGEQQPAGAPQSPSETCGYCMEPGHLEDDCTRRAGEEYEFSQGALDEAGAS